MSGSRSVPASDWRQRAADRHKAVPRGERGSGRPAEDSAALAVSECRADRVGSVAEPIAPQGRAPTSRRCRRHSGLEGVLPVRVWPAWPIEEPMPAGVTLCLAALERVRLRVDVVWRM